MEKKTNIYREKYRRKYVPKDYSGFWHMAFNFGSMLVIILFCVWRLENVSSLELLTIPATFVYVNLAEYFGHKGPMHKRVRFLGTIYNRHTKQHHNFFTEKQMVMEKSEDVKVILFPPLLMIFFILMFGLPIAVLLSYLATSNVGYLFIITAALYYVNYEALHFIYHLPSSHILSKIPGMRKLRMHHTIHHNQKLMSKYNFNITYPFADWVFGTIYKKNEKN